MMSNKEFGLWLLAGFTIFALFNYFLYASLLKTFVFQTSDAELRIRDGALLTWENGRGYQKGKVTGNQKLIAEKLLSQWKRMTIYEKNQASYKIVLGQVLKGMDKVDVRRLLGAPSQPWTVEPNQWCYDCTVEEDWHFLMLIFENGRVKDSFLMTNI